MASTTFVTLCGHEAMAKPCQSRHGPNAGKWTVKIKGPKVTTRSGIKTIHSAPDACSAKLAVAIFLKLNNTSTITEKTKVNNVGKTAAVVSAPVVMPPQNLALPSASLPPTPFVGGLPTPYTDPDAVAPYHHQYPPHLQTPYYNLSQPSNYMHPPGGIQVAYPYPGTLGEPASHFGNSAGSNPPHVAGAITPPAPATKEPPSSSMSTVSRGNKSIVPTAEQEEIYQHAKPPSSISNSSSESSITRITAGAGTGKTTTILQLAAKAAILGHSHITYVTFSRSAAADGKKRIEETMQNLSCPPIIEAHTLHACAMGLLGSHRNKDNMTDNMEMKLLDDDNLQKYIHKTCQDDMDDFLKHAQQEIGNRNKKDLSKGAALMLAAERQVLFFIFKTLVQYCRSPLSLEQFQDSNKRNYYPATKFHSAGGDGEKMGFPVQVYSSKVSKYADMAFQVWNKAQEDGIRTYDLEMKRAQLLQLPIAGSLLLVDESQDMDGCQVDWISCQKSQIFVVGDAAQTIYSFRGAKSKYMMDMEAADCTLTKSWRFGKQISEIANLVLYAKTKSPQTTANDYSPIWKPYRVEGCGGEGIVTADSILDQWREGRPVTIIAAANATLLHIAVSLLGMTTTEDDEETMTEEKELETAERTVKHENAVDKDKEINPSANNADEASLDGSQEPHVVTESDVSQNTECTSLQQAVSADTLPICMPKIHINGKGENSGMKKWKSVMKQIQQIFDLYKSGEDGAVLPRGQFYEFHGQRLTWNSFCAQVEQRELGRYTSSIHVINTFGDKTMEAMALFEREVMDKNYESDDADIVLSTCHAAKGMEWDNVQVCDELF